MTYYISQTDFEMTFIRSAFIVLITSLSAQGQINPIVTSSSGNYSLTCTNPSITLAANSTYSGNVTYTWENPQSNIVSGTSIAATVPGLYTLTASSGTILETVTLTVISNTVQPTLMSLTATGSITCGTHTVLLTASSNPTNVFYMWIEPGVGFGCTASTCIASAAGVYSLTIKDVLNGCEKSGTITVAENRNYPIFDAIGLYTIGCPNGTVAIEPTLLTPTAGVTFQWNIPQSAVTTATNKIHLITNAPGEYTLAALNQSNGCLTYTTVLVSQCVGVFENKNSSLVRMYPNPLKSLLNIQVENTTEYLVKVFDGQGRQILTGKNEEQIDFAAFSAGIYFLILQTPRERHIFKVMKE